MTTTPSADRLPADLPEEARLAITDFTSAAKAALGPDLRSLVLFGSAAEGRMRATSDVNLLVVVERFQSAAVDGLREAARLAFAAVRLRTMWVRADELPLAAEAFAVKFHDMQTRHVVLHGPDPFASLAIPRERIVQRLRQVLLNATIQWRATYVLLSLREEQIAREVAEAAAPLRSSAAAILTLEGRPAASPKAALEALASEIGGRDWAPVLERLSEARERGLLPAGVAPPTLLAAIDLAEALRLRAEKLA